MKLNFLLLPALLFAGCSELPKTDRAAGGGADARFARLSDEFISGFLAWRPAAGTALGLHEYDGKVTDFSRASFRGELVRLQRFDRELAALSTSSLSPQSLHDYR